jgi:hypothetical protein
MTEEKLTLKMMEQARELLDRSTVELQPMILTGTIEQIERWEKIYGDSCCYIVGQELK